MSREFQVPIIRYPHPCTVFVERSLLKGDKLPTLCKELGGKVALITQDNIAATLGKEIIDLLKGQGIVAEVFSFPQGEQYKSRKTKEVLEDGLLEKGYGRDSLIIALGGGIVTDVAGYVAASYSRGIPWIAVPTSLLGMVDASIGGKTGVNVAAGKNLIGATHHPAAILIDTDYLNALPGKELKNGFSEMIKHGIIAKAAVFEQLERDYEALLAITPLLIEEAVADSVKIKLQIISQDENETGLRRLLNFGHTIAHAIETASDYSVSHGEAVAMGIMAESHVAHAMGILSTASFERICSVVKAYHSDLAFPAHIDYAALERAMKVDKKSLQGHPRIVMIEEIGSPLTCGGAYCQEVDIKTLILSLEWLNNALPRH